MQGKNRPGQADIERLRGSLVTLIHRESGVKVVMPQVTTKQQARGDALYQAFVNSPPYDAPGQQAQRDWFITYDASTLPESASIAWTADLTGAATGSVVDVGSPYSTFSLVDTDTSGHALYTYQSAGLSNATGCTLEAWVQVLTADLASGMLLRIEDGTRRWDTHLYPTGVIVDDGSNVLLTRDLTSFALVRVQARSAELAVYVGGQLAGSGGPTADSTGTLVGWGTQDDPSDAVAYVVRVRAAEGVG